MESHIYHSKVVDSKGLVDWTETENRTWQTLIQRQHEVIQGRAAQSFLEGLEILNFTRDRVPQISEINLVLKKCTGFSVKPVAALIQPQEFFELLANKQFPMATFIRTPQDLDYIQEPDVFHEVYGHTPMLTNPVFTRFIEQFGKLALSLDKKYRRKLFRLFWFTIEFGMIKEQGDTRAYGAGILSSIGETQYALTDKCEHRDFNFLDILRTPYRIDIMQPIYFVLNHIEELFTIFDMKVESIMEEALRLGDHAPAFELKGKTLDTESGSMGE
ncbi:phenylalanine 4-monooxygenase [Halobacteriovorax marinus]|uniref:phenylalanine 4-monooxygenase n=1 Tax=Halobacteriovorax marinus TaxID=97084 RepID=A0A1Y5F3L8_9BACT|nr:phenylalanine 4-monooxygenase [Halobacteriovorax marinus]